MRKESGVFYRFCRNRLAASAAIMFIIIVLTAIISGFVLDYDKDIAEMNMPMRLKPPSKEHPLGTDDYGRDLLARIIYGSRYSLFIGIASTTLATLFGLIIGSLAGYFGGNVDNVIMRIMDVFLSIPSILLAIAIVASLGPGLRNLILAFTITSIPGMSRLVRVSVLSVKEQEYIESARAVGTPAHRIIVEQIWPNIIGPIIVQCTLNVAGNILVAASLSFMGLGVEPPTPEWGAMLSSAKRFMRSNPSLMFYPGLAIILTVLSINLIGDGIRDAIDPRLRD